MNKHKLKKKKRHERQIAEGTRMAQEKTTRKKVFITKKTVIKRRVYLSEVDREIVKAVIDAVRNIEIPCQ